MQHVPRRQKREVVFDLLEGPPWEVGMRSKGVGSRPPTR
jgi:hypothetical protein